MNKKLLLSLPTDISEDRLQASCHSYMMHTYPPPAFYGRYFSVPNGGSRNKIEAMKFKATGLTAGIPDYFLLSDDGQFIPIEFKLSTTTLTNRQPLVHDNFASVGVKVHIVRNGQEFLDVVDKHFAIPNQ